MIVFELRKIGKLLASFESNEKTIVITGQENGAGFLLLKKLTHTYNLIFKGEKMSKKDDFSFWDMLVAGEFPLLSMLGFLGDGPESAANALAPIWAIIAIIVAILFCVSSLS